MAQATRNLPFEEVPSALLLTEFMANKEAYSKLEKVIKEQRDEIERRINLGLTVSNSKAEAVITKVNYKVYNVSKAITAIRKFKLDAGSILKVINKAVQGLPVDVQAAIPFVNEVGNRLDVKVRKD